MKSNKLKAIMLLIIIILAEGFEVRNTGKLNRRNKVLSHSKSKAWNSSKYRSAKRGRTAIHSRQTCQVGWGFPGNTLTNALLNGLLNQMRGTTPQAQAPTAPIAEKDDVWNKTIFPFVEKLANKYFGFAVGDFTGTKISGLSDHICSSIPIGPEQTVGVISLILGHLPCGLPDSTTIKACIMFDRCGTFGLAINGGLVTCLIYFSGAAVTGVAAIVAEAARAISSASFAFSYHEKLEKNFKVPFINDSVQDKRTMEEKEVTMKGHLFAGLSLTLPLPDISMGDKKLSDYISIDATFQILFNFGKVANTVSQLITSVKNAANKVTRIVEIIRQSGMELSIHSTGSITLKLKELTKEFLPDFTIDLPSLSLYLTTGGGSTGLDTGLYFQGEFDVGGALISIITTLITHYAPIFGVLGIESRLSGKLDFLKIKFGFMLNTKYIGGYFDSYPVTIKCMYDFALKKGSCDVSSKMMADIARIFTAIWNATKFLIIKASQFFAELGDVLGVIFQNAWRAIEKAAGVIAEFLTGIGKALSDFGSKVIEVVKEVKQWFKNTAEAVWNWFSKWRRRKIRRMRRMLKLRKMRRMKKMRKMKF